MPTEQGLYKSLKTWKVMEVKNFIFQAWKIMEFYVKFDKLDTADLRARII